MYKQINQLKVIEKIEQNIKGGDYDYLVNKYDMEFSDVKIVEKEEDIDFDKNGWTLWIVKQPDEDTKKVIGGECLFLQLVNNEFGADHHLLTDGEIEDFIIFFIVGNYKINEKGSFFRNFF